MTLPGTAPVALTGNAVNFAKSGANDNDSSCTGTVAAPTAPPGKVCIYLLIRLVRRRQLEHHGRDVLTCRPRAFYVQFTATTSGDNVDQYLYATWAYTAP